MALCSGVGPLLCRAREYSFFLKTTAVNIRAGDDGAATIMAGVSSAHVEWLAAVYLEDAAPYIDAIGLDAGEANPAILALVDQSRSHL